MLSNKEMREARLRLMRSGDTFAYWSMDTSEQLVFYSFDFGSGKALMPASINDVQTEFREIDMQENAKNN